MTHQSLVALSRSAHPVAQALVAASAALMVYTVAQAALPPDPAPPPSELVAAAEPAPAPEPARLVTAFTFGEPVARYPVISPFGLRRLPWEEHGRLHAGVDIAAPAGSPVHAVAHGMVVQAGQDAAYGRYVQVRHASGLTSFYAHLGSIEAGVEPGTAVLHGAVIGRIGNTGSSTGAHLHFEMRDAKGRPLNPQLFMARQFASADELPLKAASRFPRGIRVAYVSYIPKSKKELMEARQAEKKEAAEQRAQAKSLAQAMAAPKASPETDDAPPVAIADGPASETTPPAVGADGRVRATYGSAT